MAKPKVADSQQRVKPDFAAIVAQAARDGLWVLPACLDPAEKHPAISWKEFQDHAPTAKQMAAMLEQRRYQHRNGVYITGAVLGRFTIDCDSPEAIEWFVTTFNPPPTQTRLSRKGKHFDFIYPTGLHIYNSASVLHKGVDVRGHAGCCVAVGSVHATGHIYCWEPGHSPADMPLAAAPEALLDWLRAEAAKRTAAPAAESRPFTGTVTAWAKKAITEELKTLAETPQGERQYAIAHHSFKLGQLAAGGAADGDALLGALYHIVDQWPQSEKSRKSVDSCFDAGAGHPRIPPPETEHPKGKKEKDSGSKLMELVTAQGLVLFVDTEDEEPTAFADIRYNGHIETHRLDSTRFRKFLRRLFLDATGKLINSTALSDAIETLAAMAERNEHRPVFLRYGKADGNLYIDLGRANWQIVKITRTGWSIIEYADCPIRFWRGRTMSALPLPEHVSSKQRPAVLKKLRDFISVADQYVVLVYAFIVGAMRAAKVYPLLEVIGNQGDGKSLLTIFLKRLIDPSTLELRKRCKDDRDLIVAARGTHCPAGTTSPGCPSSFRKRSAVS